MLVMLVLFLFPLLISAEVCTYGGYTCTYNKTTTCYGRNCPTCNDVQIANTITTDLSVLNNILSAGNVVSNSDETAVQQVYQIINDDIKYCQDSYKWPKKTDKGGVCTAGYFHTCKDKFGFTCYEQDCVICNDKTICTRIVNDMNKVTKIITENDIYSENKYETIDNAQTQINNMISYCEKYSSASHLIASTYLIILILFHCLHIVA